MRGFEGKALYFFLCVWRGDAVFLLLLLFFFVFLFFVFVVVVVVVFQSSGQFAFEKLYNFLQVIVLLKNTVCSNGMCWNEKKFLFLEAGSLEKK